MHTLSKGEMYKLIYIVGDLNLNLLEYNVIGKVKTDALLLFKTTTCY